MTIYHKLINGNMLNNYELGDITPKEALEQGYKPLVETPREEGKEYSLQYIENPKNIVALYIEINSEPFEQVGENPEGNLEQEVLEEIREDLEENEEE